MDKVIYGNKMYTGLSIVDSVCYCPATDFCPHISEKHLELQGRDGPLRATRDRGRSLTSVRLLDPAPRHLQQTDRATPVDGGGRWADSLEIREGPEAALVEAGRPGRKCRGLQEGHVIRVTRHEDRGGGRGGLTRRRHQS